MVMKQKAKSLRWYLLVLVESWLKFDTRNNEDKPVIDLIVDSGDKRDVPPCATRYIVSINDSGKLRSEIRHPVVTVGRFHALSCGKLTTPHEGVASMRISAAVKECL